jgi:hypothetical protein
MPELSLPPGPHPAQRPAGTAATKGLIMRHALITTHLLNQARDAAVAQAEAERLRHQAPATPSTQHAEPGRFARVVTLARRVRALAARTA